MWGSRPKGSPAGSSLPLVPGPFRAGSKTRSPLATAELVRDWVPPDPGGALVLGPVSSRRRSEAQATLLTGSERGYARRPWSVPKVLG